MSWEPIVVSSKIQGHISAGLYRTTGGALKELVTNAYDANATHVTITTNWPSFDIFTCRDNGSGITPKHFESIMRGGIGDSTKRLEYEISPGYNRPVIGRLGIGLLGVAQICYSFKVISHHASSQTAFEATVKLADYLHERMDKVDPIRDDEGTEEIEPVDVGLFDIDTNIKYDPKFKGTTIIANDMRPAFVRRFREKSHVPLPRKFGKFLEEVHQARSLRELGDYWQMIWELSVTCPIPYDNNEIFDPKLVKLTSSNGNNLDAEGKNANALAVKELCKSLKDLNFDLTIDGLSLRKPIQFPAPRISKTDVSVQDAFSGQALLIDESYIINNRPLRVFGYIYLQYGRAIEPMELRGLLIRIRNVAIGGYDPTFLNYPKIEGPRFNWLSSELYIEEGLDHALNIDRASFNQLHPHFIKIQQMVHDYVTKAFQEINKNSSERSMGKKKVVEQNRKTAIELMVRDELDSNYVVTQSLDIDTPISIDKDNQLLIINASRTIWPKAKAYRDIAQQVGIAFELAMQSSPDLRKDRFYELIKRIFAEEQEG